MNGSPTECSTIVSNPCAISSAKNASVKFCMKNAERRTVQSAPDSVTASSALRAPSSPRPESRTRRRQPRATAVRAPGMLESHYAPEAQVILGTRAELEERGRAARGTKFAIIAREITPELRDAACFALNASEDALAHELYAALREADRRGAKVIFVETPSDRGVGLALLDRLRKAAAGR